MAEAAKQPNDNALEGKIINYPGNSHKQKAEQSKKDKNITKVISGEATQRKKPLGKKIAETFIGDNLESVGHYVLFEVLLPAAKDMFFEAGKEALHRTLFGGEGSSRRIAGSSTGGNRYTSYNKMYNGGSETKSEARTLSQRARAAQDFNQIILKDRGEAEHVLDSLGAVISDYDECTVSDLYSLVGITGSYTDDKWGWTDLRGSSIERVPGGGYALNLPRPIPMD